jgi:hypothetical protein
MNNVSPTNAMKVCVATDKTVWAVNAKMTHVMASNVLQTKDAKLSMVQHSVSRTGIAWLSRDQMQG